MQLWREEKEAKHWTWRNWKASNLRAAKENMLLVSVQTLSCASWPNFDVHQRILQPMRAFEFGSSSATAWNLQLLSISCASAFPTAILQCANQWDLSFSLTLHRILPRPPPLSQIYLQDTKWELWSSLLPRCVLQFVRLFYFSSFSQAFFVVRAQAVVALLIRLSPSRMPSRPPITSHQPPVTTETDNHHDHLNERVVVMTWWHDYIYMMTTATVITNLFFAVCIHQAHPKLKAGNVGTSNH